MPKPKPKYISSNLSTVHHIVTVNTGILILMIHNIVVVQIINQVSRTAVRQPSWAQAECRVIVTAHAQKLTVQKMSNEVEDVEVPMFLCGRIRIWD